MLCQSEVPGTRSDLIGLSLDDGSMGGVDFNVLPDGEHFVMTDLSETVAPPKELAVFQDFAAELKRLVPTEQRRSRRHIKGCSGADGSGRDPR
jgi:hypothetical protein